MTHNLRYSITYRSSYIICRYMAKHGPVHPNEYRYVSQNAIAEIGIKKTLTGVLISPYPDLLTDVFCFMVRIFRLMLVLLYIYK